MRALKIIGRLMLWVVFLGVLIVIAIAFGSFMGGCSSRHYLYRTADGATIDIMIQGTDASIGNIEAKRTMPDGSVVSLHIENLTQTDRALEVTSKALDKLPPLPMPIP